MYTTLISAPTLQVNIYNPDWLICDCRFNLADTNYGRQAYQMGHIPNAHYLHLDEDLSSAITPQTGRHPLPSPAQLSAKLQAIGLNPNTQVVVYDDNNGIIMDYFQNKNLLFRTDGNRPIEPIFEDICQKVNSLGQN